MSTLHKLLKKPWFAFLFTALFWAVLFLCGRFLWAGLMPVISSGWLRGLLIGCILLLPALIPVWEGQAKRRAVILRLHALQSCVTVPYLYLLIWLCGGWLFWRITGSTHAGKWLATAAALWILTLLAAWLSAGVIRVKQYTVPSLSVAAPKIVLLSDLHLGAFTSARHLEKAVNKVMAQNPDLIVIAGDAADIGFSRLKNPDRIKAILQKLRAPFGVYRCEGNHDKAAKSIAPENDPDRFFSDCGITLLRDEGRQFPTLYLFGRRETDDPVRMDVGAIVEKQNREAPELPLVVLEHRPEEIPAWAEAGASAVLCGHTHGGQTFPGNLLFRLISRELIGAGSCGDSFYGISAGCGRWGFPARLFTPDDILVLKGAKKENDR